MARSSYVVDPEAPRAPPQADWDAMGDAERARVLSSLPSELARAGPPEGDRHHLPKRRAFEALDDFFRRRGRKVYLSSELPVYYPDEPVIAPDLIAVLDVEPQPRDAWVVSHEKKGLDFTLEIHVAGDRRKDFERNVELFARLGIPEYFVFEPRRRRLLGYRLGVAGVYDAIVPQGGLWPSNMLGLDLGLEGDRLRFFCGNAPLPDASELIARITTMVDDVTARAEQERTRAERLAAKLRELGVDPDDVE